MGLADVGVGAAYVMHYGGLTERRRHVRRVAAALPGLEVRVVTGFDRGAEGYEAGEQCLYERRRGDPQLSTGQVSLALKHVAALHHLLAHTSHAAALLLEDDAAFAQDARAFSPSLARRLVELPSSSLSYDVVFVGGCHHDWDVRGEQTDRDTQHRLTDEKGRAIHHFNHELAVCLAGGVVVSVRQARW